MMTVIPAVAAGWLDLMERVSARDRGSIFGELAGHRSDSVRCWAAYVIGLDAWLCLKDKLAGIRPFAADSHFGAPGSRPRIRRRPEVSRRDEAVCLRRLQAVRMFRSRRFAA
ncbi:hypothetical protein DQX05_27215 [Paenibacillus thiaminolyticus]|uniref:Uncharacterized protein n=2 Tax=Paenibacillus thiaminolyticus TaxID=49283 RepID=A0A3A3GAS1_PANTH|nr:hypothetical protein DQX05_27215 [Paenibacillus thiaminolyticus]